MFAHPVMHTWRHAAALAEIEIVAKSAGGRLVCELWLNGRRLDQRADAAELASALVRGWYDDLVGWPLSRMGVPESLSLWDEGGPYDPARIAPAFAPSVSAAVLARCGCDPATLAA